MRERILKHLEIFLVLVVVVAIVGFFLLRQVYSFITAYRGNDVWCTTVLTSASTVTFGHYPGMTLEEVIEEYNAPEQFLYPKEQKTTCYNSWAEVIPDLEPGLQKYFKPRLPENPTEEHYRTVIVGFFVNTEPHAVNGVWCSSEIESEIAGKVVVRHAAGSKEKINEILKLNNERGFDEYIVNETTCYNSWPEAAAVLSRGDVVLPETATEDDFRREMSAWVARNR